MDDSWKRFWESLLAAGVAVAVFTSVLQGVWFGLSTFLQQWNPSWEAGLAAWSDRIIVIWVISLVGGLGWAVWRAVQALEEAPARR